MTLINGRVTRHRTYAMISSSFRCSEASPPPEVHFLVSYEDWTMSYWSYKDECKPVDEREAVAKPTASLGVSSSEEGILYPVHTRRLRGVAGRQERAWDHLGTMSEGKEIMKFVSYTHQSLSRDEVKVSHYLHLCRLTFFEFSPTSSGMSSFVMGGTSEVACAYPRSLISSPRPRISFFFLLPGNQELAQSVPGLCGCIRRGIVASLRRSLEGT